MSFTEDRAVFFNTSDFADAGLYNGVTTVNGILDEEFAEVYQGDGTPVSTSRPVFLYDIDDLSTITVGTAFVVNGTSYTVRDLQAERGIGKLILELA